jgi:drug/metabolite transporter (DMT)-like permease
VFASIENRAIAALLGASLFGATFVVVKSALETIDRLSFISWRFLIGALLLASLAVPKGMAVWRHSTFAGLALFAG